MALMYIIYLTIWIVHSPPVSQTSSVNRMDKCLKQVNVLEGSGMRSLIILFSCLVFFRPPIEASSAGQPWTGIPQNSMINAEWIFVALFRMEWYNSNIPRGGMIQRGGLRARVNFQRSSGESFPHHNTLFTGGIIVKWTYNRPCHPRPPHIT